MAARTGLSGKILPYPLDVTDRGALEQTIAAIIKDLGHVDVAVLNVGIYIPDCPQRLDVVAIEQQFQVNVIAVMNAVAALIQVMRIKDGGKGGQIVLMSSVAGFRGLPHATGYGGTKAALINMAESLKLGCQDMRIKLQVISPGFVKTPLTDKNTFPMPFLISAEKAADYITRDLESSRFHVVFLWPIAIMIAMLRILPYGLLFMVLRRLM